MFVQKYPPPLRILHWVIAACILFMIALGWYMAELPRDHPSHNFLYGLHKSIGMTVLLLALARLIVRISRPVPSLPILIPRLQRKLANATYFIFYLLMFGVPLAGYLMTSAYGLKVSWFGLFDFPGLFSEPHRELGKSFNEIHEWLAYSLLALVGLHVSGVIKHYFVEKINLLHRMW